MASKRKNPQVLPSPSPKLLESIESLRAQGVRIARVADLQPWAENPRLNADAVPVVLRSMQRFGWTNPILVRRADGFVEAGHTRLQAAVQLGLDEVPVVELDHDVETAKQYAVADNRTAEFSGWSPELADFMATLAPEELLDVGFNDMEQVERVLKMPVVGDGKEEKVSTSFAVLVECESESHQAEVLHYVMQKGWKCRALM